MDEKHFNIIADYVLKPIIEEIMWNFNADFSNPSDIDANVHTIYNNYLTFQQKMGNEMFTKQGNLDVHKQASCLCGAILKSKILKRSSKIGNPEGNEEQFSRFFYYPNEFLAFWSATRIIVINILKDYKEHPEIVETILNVLPYIPDKLTDKHNYLSNTICYLNKFSDSVANIFSYDMYAYSTIFYHLDRENRNYLESFLSKNPVFDKSDTA